MQSNQITADCARLRQIDLVILPGWQRRHYVDHSRYCPPGRWRSRNRLSRKARGRGYRVSHPGGQVHNGIATASFFLLLVNAVRTGLSNSLSFPLLRAWFSSGSASARTSRPRGCDSFTASGFGRTGVPPLERSRRPGLNAFIHSEEYVAVRKKLTDRLNYVKLRSINT